MPRRSSGGRPASRPRAAPVRNPPQPASDDSHQFINFVATAHQAPPPAPVQGGGGSVLGGIGSTIAQGMAFGMGSGVAHRAVDAVLGPRTIQHETVAAEAPAAAAAAAPTSNAVGTDACNIHSKAFQDCINNFGSDISKCQFYLDMLNECRRSSGATLGA
ncbi:uncharacterized protein [Elaeis guineensis]|uniref:uncharacterized protein isoform X1 n=1 Tax=Elaeis guineensis var. tenera TaxID=51953 RepID=UPI003C6DA855